MRFKGANCSKYWCNAGATSYGTPFRHFRLGILLLGLAMLSGWAQTQPFLINRLAHAVNRDSGDSLVIINWTGEAGPFQVQCRASFTGEWQDVDGITHEFSQTNISTGPLALYRVVNVAGTAESADKQPPSSPTGLTATAISFKEANLSWSASSDTGPQATGVKAYNLYRNGFFLKQVPAPATSTSDTSLSPLTTCSYTVAAVDWASNQSEKSSPASSSGPWVTSFGGGSSDGGRAVAVDGSGNVFTAGWFSGTAGFGGTSLTSAGGQDIFLTKSTSSGSLLWARRFGSAGSETVTSIALDSNGNILLGGYFSGTANLGGGDLVSAGNYDISWPNMIRRETICGPSALEERTWMLSMAWRLIPKATWLSRGPTANRSASVETPSSLFLGATLVSWPSTRPAADTFGPGVLTAAAPITVAVSRSIRATTF